MGFAISVIIPVYNGERFINDIVDSLENQTFQNFETIFVNDGSLDNSLIILQKLNEHNPQRYRIVSQQNQGVSAARNAGLRIATGEHIAFVDVDDLLHPRYFECLNQYTAGKPNCVSVVGMDKQRREVDFSDVKVHSTCGMALLEDFLYGKISTGVCGMLIPRHIMTTQNLTFKEGYKYSEDLHMVWRVFCHASEVVFIDAPLYIYRDVPGSAMTRINVNRLDSLYLMKDLETYFSEYKPEFSQQFNQYGIARMAWSLLWQAAHYLKYADFLAYIKNYDFDAELKKLSGFPDKRVTLSAKCFLFSKRVYHFAVSVITKKYRG